MKFPDGNFDNEQIAILQKAFDDVCGDLDVRDSDIEGRERVARALMTLAKRGQFDPHRLRVYAASRFELAWPPK